MKNIYLFVLLFPFLFIACEKNDDSSEKANTNPTVPPPPPGSGTAAYFIEGKVNGTMYHAEYVCTYSGCQEAASRYDEWMKSIKMERNISATDFTGWDIVISEVNLDSWQLPDTLYPLNYFGNEGFSLSFYSGPVSSENNWMMDAALGDSSFVLNVTSKSSDVLEGTFSGKVRNGSSYDSTKTITDGKFKIKLYRSE